jgi:hypothetical protein
MGKCRKASKRKRKNWPECPWCTHWLHRKFNYDLLRHALRCTPALEAWRKK